MSIDPAARGSAEETNGLLRALVALALDERAARTKDAPSTRRSDVLLLEAGVPLALVAELVGKSPEALRKARQRSRQSSAAGDS